MVKCSKGNTRKTRKVLKNDQKPEVEHCVRKVTVDE